MNSLDHCTIDPLAVGLTRPAVFLGVALKVVFGNALICALLYITTQSLWVAPLFGVLHLVSLFFSLKEPRFFELFWRYLTQTPPILNRLVWGGTNSYEMR